MILHFSDITLSDLHTFLSEQPEGPLLRENWKAILKSLNCVSRRIELSESKHAIVLSSHDAADEKHCNDYVYLMLLLWTDLKRKRQPLSQLNNALVQNGFNNVAGMKIVSSIPSFNYFQVKF